MIFLFLSVFVPVATYVLFPVVLGRLTGKRASRNALLGIAGAVFFISWFLPSPLIEGRDTSFTTHVVGGGIFSGFLWLYTKRHLQLQINPFLELISIFAFVSVFGIANELFELFIVHYKFVTSLNLADTSWDLLANTLGALFFWVLYRLSRFRS